ncbi:hypothetical protein [Gephyromycinifex aptenodytis]|uniref:hypothetical protein n=1 Tax=Gephyromycinifex aptenodytis TaxID=2716227 RepID=UPI001447934A|nr:hypothetical protein [Gephyromycinifex aptenodytis]
MSDDEWPADSEAGLAEAARWLDQHAREKDADSSSSGEGRPWAGHDIEGKLQRAEMGIVAYDSSDVLTATLDSPADLRQWLSNALPHSPVSFEVYEVDVAELTRESPNEKVFLVRHELSPGDATARISYVAHRLSNNFPGDSWFTINRSHQFTPFADICCDDGRVQSYLADYCAPLNMVQDHLYEGPVKQDDPRWFGIQIPGSAVLLTFPKDVTVLQAAYDGDGATMHLCAWPWRQRIAHLRAEAVFREKWKDWYDQATPLDPVHVAATIKGLQNDVTELMRKDER